MLPVRAGSGGGVRSAAALLARRRRRVPLHAPPPACVRPSWPPLRPAPPLRLPQVLLYAQLRGNNQGVIKITTGGMNRSPAAGRMQVRVGTCGRGCSGCLPACCWLRARSQAGQGPALRSCLPRAAAAAPLTAAAAPLAGSSHACGRARPGPACGLRLARTVKATRLSAPTNGSGEAGMLALCQQRHQTTKHNTQHLQLHQIEKETRLSALINGSGEAGMLVLSRATTLALDKAREHGFGIVGTHHTSTSTGALGYYAEKVRDLVLCTLCVCSVWEPLLGARYKASGM